MLQLVFAIDINYLILNVIRCFVWEDQTEKSNEYPIKRKEIHFRHR